jgi:hypothetical protein
VPAAIIAHRVHHPGVDLLRVVVERARARTVNGSAQKADGCVDDLVLAVARDSTAQGWPPQMAGRVHQARIRRATANPMGVAGCGHWVGAEEWAARPGLSALAVCDPVFVRYLISALARREPVDDGDRARARADVLTRLDTARPSVVLDLVAELICLGATGEDRARARVAVLGALQAIHPVHVNVVFAALTCLVPTGEDRTGARAQILTALAATRPRGVSRLVTALTALAPTGEDRRRAGDLVLQALDAVREAPAERPPGLRYITGTVFALTDLAPTDADRARARAAVLTALDGGAPGAIAGLAAQLTCLAPTDDDQAHARAALLTALNCAEPSARNVLAAALTALRPTGADRARARAALVTALEATEPPFMADLMYALPGLRPTDADRNLARAEALTVVFTHYDPELAIALTRLTPGDPRVQTVAREVLVAHIRRRRSWDLPGWVADLTCVQPTDDDLAHTRARLLIALDAADDFLIPSLIAALNLVKPTAEDRAQAHTAIRARTLTEPDLVPALRSVSTTPQWLDWLHRD